MEALPGILGIMSVAPETLSCEHNRIVGELRDDIDRRDLPQIVGTAEVIREFFGASCGPETAFKEVAGASTRTP
jgi:hypothetical protein